MKGRIKQAGIAQRLRNKTWKPISPQTPGGGTFSESSHGKRSCALGPLPPKTGAPPLRRSQLAKGAVGARPSRWPLAVRSLAVGALARRGGSPRSPSHGGGNLRIGNDPSGRLPRRAPEAVGARALAGVALRALSLAMPPLRALALEGPPLRSVPVEALAVGRCAKADCPTARPRSGTLQGRATLPITPFYPANASPPTTRCEGAHPRGPRGTLPTRRCDTAHKVGTGGVRRLPEVFLLSRGV